MEQVRVLQLAPLRTGGITELILNVCENIDRERVNFDYLTFRNEKEFNEDRARRLGGTKYVVNLDIHKNSVIRGICKFVGIYKVIKRNKVKIFHINTSTPYEVLIGIAAKIGGCERIIIHSHNSSYYPGQKLKGFTNLFKMLMKMVVTDYIACSDNAAKFMFPSDIYQQHKYMIIKNGVNVDKMSFNLEIRRAYRKKYGLENNFVIGNVGRFNVQKNHKLLVDIFSEIYSSDRTARLFLIGVGELQDEIKRKVEMLGLQNVVIFHGASSEVYKLMQMMDVFVLPSLYEGLPVAGVEAQAAGLPIVLTDTITKELQITDAVSYVPLNAPVTQWSETILSYKGFVRKDTSKLLTESGFNIKTTAEILQKFYLQK